eukprot:UN03463
MRKELQDKFTAETIYKNPGSSKETKANVHTDALAVTHLGREIGEHLLQSHEHVAGNPYDKLFNVNMQIWAKRTQLGKDNVTQEEKEAAWREFLDAWTNVVSTFNNLFYVQDSYQHFDVTKTLTGND